jgi:hypothetical protein
MKRFHAFKYMVATGAARYGLLNSLGVGLGDWGRQTRRWRFAETLYNSPSVQIRVHPWLSTGAAVCNGQLRIYNRKYRCSRSSTDRTEVS